MQYTETVEPTSMARRIMEIREQVAEQLSADLLQMTAENARLQEDYQYEVSAAAIGSRRMCTIYRAYNPWKCGSIREPHPPPLFHLRCDVELVGDLPAMASSTLVHMAQLPLLPSPNDV